MLKTTEASSQNSSVYPLACGWLAGWLVLKCHPQKCLHHRLPLFVNNFHLTLSLAFVRQIDSEVLMKEWNQLIHSLSLPNVSFRGEKELGGIKCSSCFLNLMKVLGGGGGNCAEMIDPTPDLLNENLHCITIHMDVTDEEPLLLSQADAVSIQQLYCVLAGIRFS